MRSKRAVAEEPARRLPVTMLLGSTAIVFAILIAIPIGVMLPAAFLGVASAAP